MNDDPFDGPLAIGYIGGEPVIVVAEIPHGGSKMRDTDENGFGLEPCLDMPVRPKVFSRFGKGVGWLKPRCRSRRPEGDDRCDAR